LQNDAFLHGLSGFLTSLLSFLYQEFARFTLLDLPIYYDEYLIMDRVSYSVMGLIHSHELNIFGETPGDLSFDFGNSSGRMYHFVMSI
jgi:hypothetical protein